MNFLHTILSVDYLGKSIDFYLDKPYTNLKRKKEIKIITELRIFKKSEYKIEVKRWSVI